MKQNKKKEPKQEFKGIIKRFWPFNDRLAVSLIVLLVFIGSLTPVFRAMINVPYVGSYFYEMKQVLPRLGYQYFIISEVDCIGYYSYLRSTVIDHDLDFKNDFTLFGWKRWGEEEKSPTGLTFNPWSVGPAILWSPAFFVGHAVSHGMNLFGANLPTNGVSFVYDFFIVMLSMFYGLIGFLFIYFFLRFFFSPVISFLAFFFLFYASPLIFYEFHEPTMSHIPTVFAVSGLIYFWYKTWLNKSNKDWLILGVWSGLVMLIRPQDVFFIFFPVLFESLVLIWRNKKIPLSLILGLFLMGFVMVVCFIPQMLAWKILEGAFIANPQRAGFMQWSNPHVIPVMFSSNHGLITYTPIILFTLLGLFIFNRKDRQQLLIFLSFLLIFLFELYVNSAAAAWDGGWAFGGRRFLSCSIIFAWGLANLLNWLKKYKTVFYSVLGLFSLLIIFNLLFYFQWAYGMIPRAGDLTFQQYFGGKIDAFFLWLKVVGHIFSAIVS